MADSKLKQVMKNYNLTEDEVADLIEGIKSEPAKKFYITLVSAANQLMEGVQNKTLDLDDAYNKSLWKLLETGDKVTKTFRNAELDAFPENKEEETSLGSISDRLAQQSKEKGNAKG